MSGRACSITMLVTMISFASLVRADDDSGLSTVVPVSVDPRVELLSIIFNLAGNHEYCQRRLDSYCNDVESHFGSFRDHAVVDIARKLRQTRGIAFDAPMRLAVHLTDVETLELRVPTEPWPMTLDRRWTPTETEEFLSAARQFVRDASFQEFIEKHREFYGIAEQRMAALIRRGLQQEWFDEFFGDRPASRFHVTLGLLNGGCNYGVNCSENVNEDLYCVMGAWKVDLQGQPEFTDDMLETVVHEFCHSYTNEFVDRHASELEASGEKLFGPVAADMQSQGYYNATSLLYESMVRACVVRYVRKYQGEQAALKQIDEENRRKFSWVGPLSDLLEEYESQRNLYPNMEAFAPRIIRFFDDFADEFSKEYQQQQEASNQALKELFDSVQKERRKPIKELDGTAPQIVSIIPADGDHHVDPNLTAVIVIFDRPMRDRNWAMYAGKNGVGPEVIGNCAFDSTGTIWIRPIKLKPGTEYSFMLNHKDMAVFQSQDGVPLVPVDVKFKTAEVPAQ